MQWLHMLLAAALSAAVVLAVKLVLAEKADVRHRSSTSSSK
jgi:hypothetical protein